MSTEVYERFEDMRPFCQIAKQQIAARNCLETQGQPDCAGCAAPTRMCEMCHARTVTVPITGLCANCIARELQIEDNAGNSETYRALVKKSIVSCRLFKRDISWQMCEASQGQSECRGCAEPSRKCETCKFRPVRYPVFGLCLACALEDFGENWKAEIEEEEPQESQEEEPVPEHATAETAYPEDSSFRHPRLAKNGTQTDTGAPFLCAQCHAEPLRYKRSGLGARCYNKQYRENQKKGPKRLCNECGKCKVKRYPRLGICDSCYESHHRKRSYKVSEDMRSLLDRARAAIRKHGIATYNFLQKELGTHSVAVQRILEELCREGFLTKEYLPWGKRKYVYAPEKLRNKQNSARSTEEKVSELQRIIEVFGEESKISIFLRTEVIPDLQRLATLQNLFTQT